MGDISITVPVRLESSAPFGGDDRGIPFAGGDQQEGGDQTDPLGRRLATRVADLGIHQGHSDSREGDAPGDDDSGNYSEIRNWRRSSTTETLCRRCTPWAPAGSRGTPPGFSVDKTSFGPVGSVLGAVTTAHHLKSATSGTRVASRGVSSSNGATSSRAGLVHKNGNSRDSQSDKVGEEGFEDEVRATVDVSPAPLSAIGVGSQDRHEVSAAPSGLVQRTTRANLWDIHGPSSYFWQSFSLGLRVGFSPPWARLLSPVSDLLEALRLPRAHHAFGSVGAVVLLLGPPDRLLCLSLGGFDSPLLLTDIRTRPGGDSLRRRASRLSLAIFGKPQRWSPALFGSPSLTPTAALGLPVPASPGLDFGGLPGDGGSTSGEPAASGDSPPGARRSVRLAGASDASILDRAMSRKVFLAEGAARKLCSKVGKGNRERRSKFLLPDERKIRSIIDKSALCGVSLTYDEACSVSTAASCSV